MTEDEFFLLSDAMVDKSGPERYLSALQESSRVCKQCCLITDGRKLKLLAAPE
jgi:hypothetical protein